MNTFDLALLWIVTVLGFVAAVLRIKLADRQGTPQSLGWKVQAFIFPVLLLLALVLYLTGTVDIVFPAIVIALAEELVCGFIRRRAQKHQA